MPATHERIPWSEIRRRYPDEWVLVADPEMMDREEIRSGRVTSHGRDWQALIEASYAVESPSLAILFTGDQQIPDLDFIL